MRCFIANTDFEQFALLRAIVPAVDKVNFWRPESATAFRALARRSAGQDMLPETLD